MVISMSWNYLLLYVPLLLAVAGVIGATRHENRQLIQREIVANAVRITAFMVCLYAVLQVISWMV